MAGDDRALDWASEKCLGALQLDHVALHMAVGDMGIPAVGDGCLAGKPVEIGSTVAIAHSIALELMIGPKREW